MLESGHLKVLSHTVGGFAGEGGAGGDGGGLGPVLIGNDAPLFIPHIPEVLLGP